MIRSKRAAWLLTLGALAIALQLAGSNAAKLFGAYQPASFEVRASRCADRQGVADEHDRHDASFADEHHHQDEVVDHGRRRTARARTSGSNE